MMNGITSAMNPSSSSSSLLDRNQDGKVDLNDLKNQSIVTSLNDNNSNNNGGRLTGLASNQPMPMVGRMNQDNNINNINNINDINNQQSFPSSSSTSSSFIPFDSKGNQYSSSLPQGINRNFVQNQLPSSLEKNPNWMNSSSQFNGNNLNNNLNNNIINSNNLATNQQWNSKFPSGINPRELQKKRSIHQQLLGFNGNWNLNKTQTRYTDPLSYETFDSLPTGVRQQQQSSLPNSSFLNSSSQWSTPNKSSLHQELLGKNGNWNLRPVGNQYTSNVRGWNESSSLRDPNWMNSSQLTELERKKMAKREAKAAKRAKKEQKWASLSDEERRIKLAKKEAKREAKAAKKAQKMSSHNRSVPLGSIQQSDFVPASQVRMLPVEVERVEKGVVVHEHIHPIQKEEIQPIIYREREQIDVRQITQQLHETKIQPTVVNQVQLAPEVRQPIVERGMPIQENVVLPSRDIDNTVRTASVKPAIINETVRKTVVEEIQPVLERDVIQPSVIKETQPIYEKVVEAPHIQREVLPTRELGVTNSQMTGRSVSTPLTSTATLPSAYNTTGTYFHGQQHFGTQQGFVNQQGISSNSIPRMSDFAAEGGPITHAEGSLPNVASYGSSQGYLPEQSFVAPSQYQGGLSSFPQQGLANQQFDSFSQSQMTSSLPYQGLQQRSTILPPRQIYTQALPQQSRGFNTFGGISQFAAEGGPIAFAQSVGLNQAPILKTVDPNLMNARQQAPTFFRQM